MEQLRDSAWGDLAWEDSACAPVHSPLLVLQYLPPPLLNLLLVVVDDDPPAGDNLHIETGYERLASVVRRRRRLLLNLGPN